MNKHLLNCAGCMSAERGAGFSDNPVKFNHIYVQSVDRRSIKPTVRTLVDAPGAWCDELFCNNNRKNGQIPTYIHIVKSGSNRHITQSGSNRKRERFIATPTYQPKKKKLPHILISHQTQSSVVQPHPTQ